MKPTTVNRATPNSFINATLTSFFVMNAVVVSHASAVDNIPVSAEPSDTQTEYSLVEIMPPLNVSGSQKIAQQTPIAYHDGNVYIVNTEPGEAGDIDGIDLHTVIRHGVPDTNGQWSWSSNILHKNTIYDPWHTSPAVGVDRLGHVHVAYNMHNFPWQYMSSNNPDSIEEFTFLGDDMSLSEIKKAKFENKTTFKTMGYAAIPGNQITYPAFYRDPSNSLYVSYRFAAKPARTFESRTMSAGVAKHTVNTGEWQSLGGDLNSEEDDYKTSWLKDDNEPLAIASQIGWTAYHPRLAFDDNGTTYIFFYWRKGIAGETLAKPCIIKSTDLQKFTTLDGLNINLPVTPKDCSNISAENDPDTLYNTIGSIAASSDGEIHIVVSPTDQPRRILNFSKDTWSSEASPYAATEIFIDKQNNLWAIASGLTISRKLHGNSDWETIISTDEKTQCYPKVSLNEDRSTAFIYSQSCDDSNTVSAHSLRLFSSP